MVEIDIAADQRRKFTGSSSGFAQSPRRASGCVDALDGRSPCQIDFLVLESSEPSAYTGRQTDVDARITYLVAKLATRTKQVPDRQPPEVLQRRTRRRATADWRRDEFL